MRKKIAKNDADKNQNVNMLTVLGMFKNALSIICAKGHRVGCVFLVVIVSILLYAEFGQNDHLEVAPHFIKVYILKSFVKGKWL